MKKNIFYIDKITNSIEDALTGKSFETHVLPLVAFACKTSFEAGFEGFVAFTAKSKLIKHYVDTLGAELIFRNRMSISGNAAKKLVNSYFKNFLHEK